MNVINRVQKLKAMKIQSTYYPNGDKIEYISMPAYNIKQQPKTLLQRLIELINRVRTF